MKEVACKQCLQGERGLLREACKGFFPAQGAAVPSKGEKWNQNDHVLSPCTEHSYLYQFFQVVRLTLQMRELRFRAVKGMAKRPHSW